MSAAQSGDTLSAETPFPHSASLHAGYRSCNGRSELQRPRLLHLRQRAHLGEHVGGQLAVDLDQRDRVAAGRLATDMEGRDVDAGFAERRGETADEAGL